MNLSNLLKLTNASCLLQGLCGSAKGWFFVKWHEYYKKPILIIAKGQHEAEAWLDDFETFGAEKAVIFPAWEDGLIFESLDSVGERWNVLENPPEFIITMPSVIKHKVIPLKRLSEIRFEIKKEMELERDILLKWFVDNGYDRVDVVDIKGEFSHRGGIVDTFPPNNDYPIRIEFVGDIVESIRFYDPQTQCSIKESDIPRYIYPVDEPLIYEKYKNELVELNEYLTKNTSIILDEPDYLDINDKEIENFKQKIELSELVEGQKGIIVNMQSLNYLSVQTKTPDILALAREKVFSEISKWMSEGFNISVWCNNDGEKNRLLELLHEKKFDKKGLDIRIGIISSGFVYTDEKIVIISDEEIFNRYKVKLPRRKFKGYGIPIQEFTELEAGDYVVHIDHGIGKFLGVQKEGGKEMLVIQYAQKAKLYVPVKDVFLIERYMGLGGKPPKLNKLSGNRWLSTKIKVEKSLMDVAGELLEMQAKRKALGGIAYSSDKLWQKEMEDSFIYEETPDQLVAVNDVKHDMESTSPMDRLICGDVGYGKTEVAIRAAFKAVLDGKQVAILVPTTILAQQHYRTFSDRLADYPVKVEMLSRFRNEKQQREIVKQLREGKIDIIVGTHRIVQPDIKFKDLGLVIIDEEQRFGVQHKERLKKLRELVDVITMTATPIPRTLYMSLLGIKDMSVINTPPQERLAVKTIISEYDEKLIRDAILKEIHREGQVYFLHNRVETIEKVADRLAKLVPEAKFLVGHGQMDEELLALVMDDFVQGKADVLVCTTIIQSGLDIPNVNTIIIDNADTFGLADLYQLRGRVGRYIHQAYAYLLLGRGKIMVGQAKKRLKAIQDFSHLGAGFKIAMQDLEIRGAGNILGFQQHGNIQAVGFEMYCKLLHKNIMKLQNKIVEEPYEVIMDLGIDGHIPIEYIPSDKIRIEFYKRIAGALNIDELNQIKQEMKDRFGALPKELIILLDIVNIKLCSIIKKIKEIRLRNEKIFIQWLDGKQILEDAPKDAIKWLKKKICPA